ncbi:ExeM/NucH family extracellular endonuclease [Agromyces sp. NPDC058484]|uniref:ExeM/NucH family extracellular endonuclease n=1 Tax=Agromyces sp. NPDC058484 TaxID=3346524 RepID=UPI003652D7B0
MRRFVRRSTVTIAAASLLTVGLYAAPAAAADPPSDLIISEYVEGSSTNKAVELYNPTDTSIDLTQYALSVYFNGSTTSTDHALAGAVAAGGTFVFADNLLAAYADQTTGAGLWNGDDAVVLRRGAAVVDSLGQVGVDPGSQWGADLVSTQDNTLRRAGSVCAGDTDPSDAFDPAAEWEGHAQDTFDGLGSHTADCGDAQPAAPVINEFSASTAGTDVEYVELLVEPGTDVSGYAVLEIEGDTTSSNGSPTPTAPGTADEVITFGAPDADGRALASLAANTLENGTISLLLVTGFAGAVGDDLDANDDGVLELPDGVALVDAVAVDDGTTGDATYGGVTLGVSYDGLAFAPGGASRIPDGTDTDSTADWVRNDFDLAGIPGNVGTLIDGEAVNTPGAENSTTIVVDPPDEADCEASVVSVGSVQGSGDVSPVAGQTVEIEGVVVGDFQTGGFDGYYLQDAGDADAATSDGVFVFAPGGVDVAMGDVVHVVGSVSEFFGMTEVTADAVAVCETGAALPDPVEFTLPAGPEAYEPLEGMRVTLPQPLVIGETFEFARFGQLTLGTERLNQPTAIHDAGSPEAIALAEANARNAITIDDGRSAQNPDPAIHPNGEVFTLDNTFRSGDVVQNATGVLDFRFDLWAVQPTEGADFTVANPRPEVPEVGGTTTVASFNVLNYFTTFGSRGADDQVEFDRQEAKIVSAMSQLDADIFGLIEIENNGGTALNTLVDALNEVMGAGTYAAIDTGVLGTDAITTALIYKPAEVAPVGDFAVLDSSVDPRFLDDKNRPVLAQTFTDLGTGGEMTVAVNHLKSKGSSCEDVGDPTDPNGQGNCNGVRTAAAEAMVDWLAGDPTGQGAGRELIIGDLNSYDHEDPIQVLTAAGFTDLEKQFHGEEAYSYVFDGQLGYLDYALAGADLVDEVTGAAAWHINADEPTLIDYDMTFKKDAQDALFAPDAFRSSDHDPVLIGLDLTPPDTTAPELTVRADPSVIWPPNNKWRTVTIDVEASDDSGEVSWALVETRASGNRKAAIEVVSDTEVRVRASIWSTYTLVYEATDPSGNTTTREVKVRVTLLPWHRF